MAAADCIIGSLLKFPARTTDDVVIT